MARPKGTNSGTAINIALSFHLMLHLRNQHIFPHCTHPTPLIETQLLPPPPTDDLIDLPLPDSDDNEPSLAPNPAPAPIVPTPPSSTDSSSSSDSSPPTIPLPIPTYKSTRITQGQHAPDPSNVSHDTPGLQ